jgi:predicted negative regulator of RcsB-dependent stress response
MMMEQIKEFLMKAWEWLNAPLPIVGVSLIVIALFLWRVYAASSVGKKQLNTIKRGFEDTKEKLSVETIKMHETIQKQSEEIARLRALLVELILTIPNKKVQNLISQLGEENGTKENEETTNS